MYRILKGELKNSSKFKNKLLEYTKTLKQVIHNKYDLDFDDEEITELLLSACRSNDFNVIYQYGNKMFLNEEKVLGWIEEKLLPNIVIAKLDDADVLRLLIFCIEITYQMFSGGTKATVSQKGFRDRRRTFEAILADQFVGKLGEIFVKKYLEETYNVNIMLDWDISSQIDSHRNDIRNARKKISIKSSPTLAGIWAEADIGYEYGIAVKCSVPQQPILQFFIEVCGFTRLLDFAEDKIPSSNGLFMNYLSEMRERIRKYKCGEIQTNLKGFICGYFNTSEHEPVKKGEQLPYLGEVREERYLIPINKLKWTKDDWKEFLRNVSLL